MITTCFILFRLQYDEEFNIKNQALRALEKEMLERVERLQEVFIHTGCAKMPLNYGIPDSTLHFILGEITTISLNR